MKRIKTIFPEIVSVENLYTAAFKAARGKSRRTDVQEFFLNLDGELFFLQRELSEGTYQPGPTPAKAPSEARLRSSVLETPAWHALR